MHRPAIARSIQHLVVSALCCALCASAAAASSQSRFKVAEAKATKEGAVVYLIYDNDWGSPRENRANAKVHLWLNTSKPDYWQSQTEMTDRFGVPYIPENATSYGVVEMLGRGKLAVKLDYKQHGLKAGDKLWISGTWVKSRHTWGEVESARKTGFAKLPAANPNARWTVGTGQIASAKLKLVNINLATAQELTILPWIGPARAAKIVAFRNGGDGAKPGHFKRPSDLLQLVGPKTLAKMAPQVRVRGRAVRAAK